MPLGIISDSEFNNELLDCSSDKIIPSQNDSISNSNIPRGPDIIESIPTESITSEIVNIKSGRGAGNTEVPEALRKVLGETSVINGRSEALDLASMLGVSASSVSAYKEGAHSTSSINTPDKDTKSHIDASKLRVTTRARKKLNLALSHITDDKLSEAKVGEIASVAKAMAGVIKDLEPSTDSNDKKSNIPFVVFAPIIKQESTFEIVHAKDDY